jgi:membrane fusion protein, multidrug efflux system
VTGTRRRTLLIGIVALITGGAVAGLLLASGPAAGQPSATSALPPATAEVTRMDLVQTTTVSGTLGYGDPVPISATGSGTLTWLAPVGSTVSQGESLFRVDEQPVVALYGSVPMYRPLEDGAQGTDVTQLQENLAAMGYTGFEQDGIWSEATGEALRAWQADLGLLETGRLDHGQVVFLPGPMRIAQHSARLGDPLRGSPVLSYTSVDRVVSVELTLAELELAGEGQTVPIRLPGGDVVEGEIAQVSTVVTESDGTNRRGAAELRGLVTITIADQAALGDLEAAPVEVEFASAERPGVLTVPVAALLALAEGGYGVEIVEGDATRIVPVTTGMFASGRVEISGPDIAEGVTVGVAR